MSRCSRWVISGLAALTFLAPLKFGVLVVVQSALLPPRGTLEWIFFLWPNPLLPLLAFGALSWCVLDPCRAGGRRNVFFYLPALFLVTQLVAVPGSINRHVSMDTVLLFAVGVLLFYGAAWYVRDEVALMRVAGGMGLAAILVCVVALEQYATGFAATEDYARAVASPPEFVAKLAARRVFGTLVSPNALAGFLVVAVGPTLACLWQWTGAWRAGVRWLVLIVLAGLMVVVLVLTGSRGGLASLAAGLVAVLMAVGGQRSGRLVGWTVVGLFVVLGAAHYTGRLRWGGESVAARWDYWQGAVCIIRDHVWRGTGPGTFGSIYPFYKTASTEEAQTVHNSFLQIWSDSGLAAFVVFTALSVTGLGAVFRLARQRRTPGAWALAVSVTGWMAHGLMDFDLYVPGVAVPAWILLGAVAGLHDPPGLPVGPRRWWVKLGVVLVVVVVSGVAGRGLVAAFWYGRARETGDLFAAEQAVRWQPANSHYLATAGDCAFTLGRAELAVYYYRTAATHDPWRATYPARLARALWASGARDEARRALQRAMQLNPTNEQYRRDWATLLGMSAVPEP